MVQRHRLGKALGRQPAPAPEQVSELPFGIAERAGKGAEIRLVRAVIAEEADRCAHRLVIGSRGKGLLLCHAGKIGAQIMQIDPILTVRSPSPLRGGDRGGGCRQR